MRPGRGQLGLGALALGVAGLALTWPDDGAGSEGATVDGVTLFRLRGCPACHVGPATTSLTGLAPPLLDAAAWAADRRPGLSAEQYLAESIRSPGVFRSPAHTGTRTMPNLGLTDEEIDALVTYLLDG